MKHYAIIAILTAAAGSAQARGFQPWGDVAANPKAATTQSDTAVNSGAFYSDGLPKIKTTGTPAVEQADVIVKPWYAADRA